MEPRAKYTFVGSAVLTIAIFIIGFGIWISGDSSGDKKKFTIYFKEQSLDGLQIESAVTLKGIQVGIVKQIELSKNNIEKTQVIVELENKIPVKTDTRAVIKRNILTGFATIDLAESTNQSELLLESPDEEPYPVIPEGRSELSAFAASLPELVSSVNVLVTRVSDFLSENNRISFTNTLSNVETVSNSLVENNEKFGTIVNDFSQLSTNLKDMSGSINKISKKADRSLSEITQDFSSALNSINETSDSIRQDSHTVATTLATSAKLITQNTENMSGSLSEAARALSRAAEGFEDPKAIITGPGKATLGPGEYLKK